MNNVLQAFINQTYGSTEKMKEAYVEATNREKLLKDWDNERLQQAASIMSRDQSISNHTNIPTQLKPDQLNEKTVSHPNMNYDHSLTLDRKSILREKYLNQKYKDNPQDKPNTDSFTEDWGELDDDGDLPIL